MLCIGYAKSVPDEGSFLIGEAAPSPALAPLGHPLPQGERGSTRCATRVNLTPAILSYLRCSFRVLCSRRRAKRRVIKNQKRREETPWRSDIFRCPRIRRSAD